VLPEITDPAIFAEAKKSRVEVAARLGKRK
jgi:hypothetical protein